MITLTPDLFSPAAIAPETAAFVAELEATLATLPPTHEIPVALSRQARDEGKSVFPTHGPLDQGSEWVEIGGGKRVRVSLPEGAPRGTYVHFHGGGWSVGRPSHQDGHNQALAKATGAAVVSVEYRLAPEHPFPAGPQDCLNGARWVIEHAPYGDGPVILGGESAGAHLAATTLLGLRAAGLMGRVAGVVFNYGCFDIRLTPSARNWGRRQLILSTPTMDFFSDNFVPEKGMRGDPDVSPIVAELTGMPPALFQIGTEDPLLDDSLIMAARWMAAGGEAELAVYPGGVHAFEQFPDLAISRDFQSRRAAFVARRLG